MEVDEYKPTVLSESQRKKVLITTILICLWCIFEISSSIYNHINRDMRQHYNASIQWNVDEEGDEAFSTIITTLPLNLEDDSEDFIFFYFKDEEEIKSYMTKQPDHEFFVVSYSPIK